jgi:hypothetical protein
VLAGGILLMVFMTGLMIWVTMQGLSIRRQVEPVAGWQQTSGWIASFNTVQTPSNSQPVYYPLIGFRAQGRIFTFRSPTTLSLPTVGARAQVSYDPRDPAQAHDLSMGSAWKLPFYGGLVGAPIFAAATAFGCWLVFGPIRPLIRRAARGATAEGRHVSTG